MWPARADGLSQVLFAYLYTTGMPICIVGFDATGIVKNPCSLCCRSVKNFTDPLPSVPQPCLERGELSASCACVQVLLRSYSDNLKLTT